MGKSSDRVLLLIVDQLAGHWAEGVVVPSTGYPPPNVEGYYRAGLLPRIGEFLEQGIWVRHPYNMGKCETRGGLKYLMTGSYSEGDTLIRAVREHCGGGACTAAFATTPWVTEYFHADYRCELPSYYPDEPTLFDYALPWLEANPDWRFVILYLPEHDLTATDGGLPVYVDSPKNYLDDKHHHLVDRVDSFVGATVDFLKEKGWWDGTYLLLCSDHAYHLGCDAVSSHFSPNDGPRRSRDLCWNHVPPHDCLVWDFVGGKASSEASNCCRRVTFALGGGALPKRLRGVNLESAEIIDVPATIASLLGVSFSCDGRSILDLFRKER
ncbi:MAG: hypothetical protein ACUVXI_03695 [bacterium]